MEIPLAGDFVPAADHFCDHMRLVLCDPAEDEERRPGAHLVQEIKRRFGIPLDATFKPMPVVRRHHAADRRHVAIVFQHNREDMPPPDGLGLRGILSHFQLRRGWQDEPQRRGMDQRPRRCLKTVHGRTMPDPPTFQLLIRLNVAVAEAICP